MHASVHKCSHPRAEEAAAAELDAASKVRLPRAPRLDLTDLSRVEALAVGIGHVGPRRRLKVFCHVALDVAGGVPAWT